MGEEKINSIYNGHQTGDFPDEYRQFNPSPSPILKTSVQEGWRCPVCGSVYAPWVMKCDYCSLNNAKFTSNTNCSNDQFFRKPLNS